MNKKPKLIHSIKGKLISATCMLLVAMIMVVSSTYAWFTLSTAPEVKGIQTAVGANGALEMLLLTKDAEGNWVYDSVAMDYANWKGNGAVTEKNKYWGNLVDLSETTEYGLDKITLYPSQLNATDGVIGASPLMTPVYGADGRVSEVTPNTQFGKYTSNGFLPMTSDKMEYGVRAVGTSSGLTPRQMAYTNAASAAATAGAQAKNIAAFSLNEQGSALADIALKHGMNAAATHTVEEIESLIAIVDSLLGTEDAAGALEYIEYAYMQYILAFSASKHVDNITGTDGTLAENLHTVVAGYVNADGATLESVITKIETLGATLPTVMHNADGTGYMDKLITTMATVATARATLAGLIENAEDDAEFTWGQISGALHSLCDTSVLNVNGYKVEEIKSNTGSFASKVLEEGLQINMPTGAGVYADIADHCGDFSSVITIKEIQYNGATLENQKAKMQTATTVKPYQYVALTDTAVTKIEVSGNFESARPASTNAEAMPLSEFYGYVIDLAFRTNALESNLLLQTDAIDRIYDSNNNAETRGGGSSMTFASASTDFDNDSVTELMSNIRIVFFDPEDGTIIAKAGLDTANTQIGADGVTAKMYILAEDDTFLSGSDAVISALEQNEVFKLSVLVYLDGTTITNADVAATAAKSMTGKMNLQFSSSANLVPMEYADLHIQGTTAETTVAPSNP